MTEKIYTKLSVKELEALVRKHNQLYFVDHAPEISDEEFDVIVETLKKKAPHSQVLSEIGSDLGRASKAVTHSSAMLSLDKCYDDETFFAWAKKCSGDVVASPKVDGLAISLVYGKSGALEVAATRGDGAVGEDVTQNVMRVSGVVKKISKGPLEVRGEVYMPLAVFEGFKEEFANPRNLAAGALKQKDPQKTANYRLSFWAYDVLGGNVATEDEKRKLLKKLSFDTLEWKLVRAEDVPSVYGEYLGRRNSFGYEMDGVVIKINSLREQEELGATLHHPRYAIAYKFQGDSGETHLREVEWSVARTGAITPVGIVEPVVLSGATVTRVSLHNWGLVKNMGLTIGAKVLMVRRGGVIPNLERVIEKGSGKIVAPTKCPSCGSRVRGEDDFLYCTTPEKCVASRIGELKHFVTVMEIDGLGDVLLEKLINTGLVKDAASLYDLTAEELLSLERMGDVLAAKVISNIRYRRSVTFERFLMSLGISEIGRHAAGILAKRYKTLRALKKADVEELSLIHSIGEVTAVKLIDGLKEKHPLIERLLERISIEEAAPTRSDGPFSGKSVMFTGSLGELSRKDAQKFVEDGGGHILGSVSKNLNILVTGEDSGSKLDKAKKLNEGGAVIEIMNADEFKKRMKL